MDTGHYNCRDYHISPHWSATTYVSTITTNGGHPSFHRHESFQELEHRSKSPASFKPKFPLLSLPLELRQHVLSYLLPKTQEFGNANPLTSHARNFSAVQKRGARGMVLPTAAKVETQSNPPSNVVWQRGNINIMSVCRQLHDEAAELVYCTNTFLLFVTFSGITFRFRWLLPSGLAPSRSYSFLELLPEKYLRLVRKVVVHVDHVDSYTGMIKFNVGGKGLTHGLRRQVQRLVNTLQPMHASEDVVHTYEADSEHSESQTERDEAVEIEGRRLAKVFIRVSNGNAVMDSIKSEIVRQREGSIRVNEDLEEMLEPFGDLAGVREASVTGAVNEEFALALTERMKSTEAKALRCIIEDEGPNLGEVDPQLCVYGNDI